MILTLKKAQEVHFAWLKSLLLVQNRHAGEQGMHWNKMNEKLTTFSLVCLFQVHPFFFIMAGLDHVND